LPVAATVTAIAVAGAGLLVYFKKRKKESGDKS
jgi:LPXTG-motif cell wall-anchored protein